MVWVTHKSCTRFCLARSCDNYRYGGGYGGITQVLTHWGRVTHICVSKLTIIGSYNGLSPDRRQAIIWTNAGLLLIEPLGTNFSEILNEILTLSFKKMCLKVSSAKRRPFCLGLNGLSQTTQHNKAWALLMRYCIFSVKPYKVISTFWHTPRPRSYLKS